MNGELKIDARQGLYLSARHWLQTSSSVTSLTEKLIESSQFTLDIIIATADLQQIGPARIISISNDPFHRNLTVSQAGDSLSIRLRTPLTGENGLWPELIIPKVFQDTNPHRMIIAYNGVDLAVYIDHPEQRYTFTYAPEVMLFRYLLPVDDWKIRLTAQNPIIFKVLFYSLIFTPIVFILTLMIHLKKKNEKNSLNPDPMLS